MAAQRRCGQAAVADRNRVAAYAQRVHAEHHRRTDQANLLTSIFGARASLGLDRIYWFSFRDMPTDPDGFGMVRRDMTLRPWSFAFQAATSAPPAPNRIQRRRSTTSPSNQTVTAGANATFTVAASGIPAATYQWQISTDGGVSFSDLGNATRYSGVTTGTLAIASASTSLNGARYRANATNSAGSATSSAAVLTVNRPTIGLTPATLLFKTNNNLLPTFLRTTSPQILNVSQSSGGAVSWTASANQPWVTVTPTSGSGSAALTVSIIPDGFRKTPILPVSGSVTATVTITAT